MSLSQFDSPERKNFMELVPLTTFRKTSNQLYTLVYNKEKFLVKCYQGSSACAHRKQEQAALRYWKEAGYNVPDVFDVPVPELEHPCLVMTCVEGPSLREYLSTNTCVTEEKLQTLARLFREISERHKLAIKDNNRNLVHYDPSSGNIICSGKKFYYVDFESTPKYKSVIEAAASELSTLCRWIVRDLGIEFLEEILKLAVTSYADQEPLLKVLVKRTSGRPFQFYHRWKNKRRKLASPGEVTKYDIADGLAKLKVNQPCPDQSL